MIYVITRKIRRAKNAFPLCYQDTRKDANLFIQVLKDDPENSIYTFGIRPIKKGVIEIALEAK